MSPSSHLIFYKRNPQMSKKYAHTHTHVEVLRDGRASACWTVDWKNTGNLRRTVTDEAHETIASYYNNAVHKIAGTIMRTCIQRFVCLFVQRLTRSLLNFFPGKRAESTQSVCASTMIQILGNKVDRLLHISSLRKGRLPCMVDKERYQ